TSTLVSRTMLTKRLHRVEMYGPDVNRANSLLRAYELYYGNESITARSLLEHIYELDGSGVRLGTTDLSWELGEFGFDRDITTVTDYYSGQESSGYRLVDIDNDGYADLFYVIKGADGDPHYAVRLWLPGLGDFGSPFDLLLKPTKDPAGLFTFPRP